MESLHLGDRGQPQAARVSSWGRASSLGLLGPALPPPPRRPPPARPTVSACCVLGRDAPPGPLIYGHWCNSFNVIYLTAEEMANAWRMIGHAGFVHF